ncbi:hypothetical protein, partial [Escherichia coli]
TVSGTLENRGRLVSDDVLTLSATQINNSGMGAASQTGRT